MKRFVLTGVVAFMGLAAPVGTAVGTAAAAAPAVFHTPIIGNVVPRIGERVLPLIGRHLVSTSRNNSTSTSTNWSGYADTGDTFQNVTGSWVEPTVTCPTKGGGLLGLGGAPTSYAAFWVGLDGYTSSTVEQTGTDSDCNRGAPTYYAWYEMYPAASVDLSSTTYPVSPGDTMTGTVKYNGSSYTLSLSDSGAVHHWNWNTTVNQSETYARSSAEWVAEAPQTCTLIFCSVTTLAHFSNFAFSNASATDATRTGAISSFTNDAITMVSSGGVTESTPGPLNGSGNGFGVTWDAG